MNRRTFLSSMSGLAIAGLDQYALPTFLLADPVNIQGSFGFKFENGQLKMDAKDVVIDGLSFQKFTWAWIGLSVAEGVLAAFGGAVFSAVVAALVGSGKSMEQLLKEQLAEFAHIVESKLEDAQLREYQAEVAAFITLFEEYNNTPNEDRFNFLINQSAVALSKLESLGFKAYRTYMIAAGLRMTVLQELVKQKTAGSEKNLDTQRVKAIAHHDEMIKVIDKSTVPPKMIRTFEIQPAALGYTTNEKTDKWNALRKLIKRENTDVGEKMVTRWLGGKPR